MRISDWSSDVCSSDLVEERAISRCGMQLEAYCTGIGKALLANLPPADQADYLASGSFVPLTKTTLVTAEDLKGVFDHIVARGYAVDNEELIPGLVFIAAHITSSNKILADIPATDEITYDFNSL